MSYFPNTRLLFQSGNVLVVSGAHFHVVSAHAGELLYTTTTLQGDALEKLLKSGPIRCIAVDSTFTHIATTGDDKKLKVWKVTGSLELLHERELPKKPTEVGFTHDGQTVVISDKFGDVFSYPLHPVSSSAISSAPTGASKRGSLTSHENPSDGTLILGHASMVTTFLLTPDERYIITPDRDEHIRVSWYPQGYAIERYCLGHEKFVSAIHIPSFQTSTLISGGGDPVLKVWDWMFGTLLADVSVFQVAEPFIKVKAAKRRRGWGDGDGDGEMERTEEGQQQKKGKGKGRKDRGKGKGKGKGDIRDGSADIDAGIGTPTEEQGDQVTVEDDAGKNGQTNTSTEEEALVFVIHKIRSVNRGENGQFIIFSVVGATALFYTPLPQGGTPSSESSVQAIDFGVPVVDFATDSNDDVWVLLDAQWPSAQNTVSASPRFVRLLTWDNATLCESAKTDAPLLTTLNTKCLVSATPSDLKTLDLYSDLSSMPKNVDPEHDALIRDTLSEAAMMDPGTDGKQLTQRELGRLKKKKALLAKIQEREETQNCASREGLEMAEAETGREVKKSRSENEGDVNDVAMDAS